MDVNVKGMFLVTKAFARGMIRRKSGSIVNVGSLAGMRMLEVPVHYATAKSASSGSRSRWPASWAGITSASMRSCRACSARA